MINHISIGVNNPEKVANFFAELWNGIALPFPPCPNSFIVLANDGRGTAIEITPLNTVLVPGEGMPAEENFDKNTLTEKHEGHFVQSDFSPRYVATHLNISTDLSEAEIKAIGMREGWRTLTCNRDRGLFQLVEIWIEDRILLEVFTPEMTQRYVEITDPQFLAAAFQIPLPADSAAITNVETIA